MSSPKPGKESEDLKAKTLDLAGLAVYQKGAIVSREVLRKKTGTVTVFAFDKDEALSEHTAPFDALVLGLDGEAEVTISGRAHKVAAGDMIIMPAGEPHAVKAVRKFKMALIMIRS
jgi:quercetin dioxygenase-like cupin family protein